MENWKVALVGGAAGVGTILFLKKKEHSLVPSSLNPRTPQEDCREFRLRRGLALR